MSSRESPAVARRRLRLALRREREAKGLTQGQVAQALDWSLSKVNRIENGDVTISSTDLQALLRLLGVTDDVKTRKLAEDAKISRRRGWWDEAHFREHLTPATLQLLQFESQASTIRSFHSTLVPGLIQTRAYAESIFNFWDDELSEERRKTRLEVRMLRKSQVFGQADWPNYYLVLDESVVHREMGGPKVMADQLDELVAMSHRPGVEIRILPFRDAAQMAHVFPFTVFDLGDEESAAVYREGHLSDEITHASAEVRRHRRIFELMWDHALPEEASIRLVEAQVAAMRASLARGPT